MNNTKGTSDGVYDAPCEVDKPEHTSGPCAYEVPRSSALVSSYEAVLCDNTEENDTLQGETCYNMGHCDTGASRTPTATPTYSNTPEHHYQETDAMSKRAHPMLEVSVLTMGHLVTTDHVQCKNACLLYFMLYQWLS